MSNHISINPLGGDCSFDLVTLGERGQVVIPTAIRTRLGLKSGDKLLIFTKHNSVIGIVPASSIKSLIDTLAEQLKEIDKEETN